MTSRLRVAESGAHPPARGRSHIESSELTALEECTGVPFEDADARVLLDPRGQRFQRLEWLGDSVLDAIVACWLLAHPDQPPALHSALTSDDALARAADLAGLPALLDWMPSRARRADLIEACIGAAWRTSPATAVRCAARLLGASFETTTLDVATTDPGAALAAPAGCQDLRAMAAAGSYALEAAAAVQAFTCPARADWDEGQLSRERAHRLSGAALLRRRAVHPPCGPRSHLLDHVQAEAGAVLAQRGLVAGIDAARELLGPLPVLEASA